MQIIVSLKEDKRWDYKEKFRGSGFFYIMWFLKRESGGINGRSAEGTEEFESKGIG